MFERYTEPARRTLFFARYEASRLGSQAIEDEHLLLGLIREPAGLAAAMLETLPLADIRRELEGRSAHRRSVSTSVEIPFSPAVKRALQHAAEEADRLRHWYIGPEHLLLGLLWEDASPAASVLAGHGLRLESARERLLERAAQPPSTTITNEAARTQVDRVFELVHQLRAMLSNEREREAVARVNLLLMDLQALKTLLDGSHEQPPHPGSGSR